MKTSRSTSSGADLRKRLVKVGSADLGHHQVAEDDVEGGVGLDSLERFARAGHRNDFVVGVEQEAQRVADLGLVIDDQKHDRARLAGPRTIAGRRSGIVRRMSFAWIHAVRNPRAPRPARTDVSRTRLDCQAVRPSSPSPLRLLWTKQASRVPDERLSSDTRERRAVRSRTDGVEQSPRNSNR